MIEIVCCTPGDALLAPEGGATQIELCVAIELGGLTPSPGLVSVVKQVCDLPVMAMLRPRGGDFFYSDDELRVMELDAEHLLRAGADGLVFGVLRGDRTIDRLRCSVIRNIAEEVPCVFHRAFDQTPDLSQALEVVIELGFDRVLTSGGVSQAVDGADVLRSLESQAAGRIQVLPGGGIRPHNALEVLKATGIERLHLAPFVSGKIDVDMVKAISGLMRQYCGTTSGDEASTD